MSLLSRNAYMYEKLESNARKQNKMMNVLK